jgi:two-component system KDP operon response regulator KdpE
MKPGHATTIVSAERVLLVSDTARQRRVVRTWLERAGYQVTLARDGGEAIEAVSSTPPHVVVVDLGPVGLNLVHDLRRGHAFPIVVLDTDDEGHLVAALDAGADDYVAKPPPRRELLARIAAVLRRRQLAFIEPWEPIITPDFTLDLVARRVITGRGEVRLTPIEWRLVDMLGRHPDQLVSQQELLNGAWGPAKANHTHYLRVHMRAIRVKLEPDPSHPRYFRTEAGSGVRFCPNGSTPEPDQGGVGPAADDRK